MEAYLDNAATTKTFTEVNEVMLKVMCEDFGNPSSMHGKGLSAEHYIKEAKETIAKTLKVKPDNIVFTSGGSESNNMALIGGALANKRAGNHIITTVFEHASVYEPLLSLKDFDFRVSFAPVDSMGHIVLDKLLEEICDDTIMVSIMYCNNEIGAVQNIAEISKAVKAVKKDILIHVDAIQGYGKYKINPTKEGIDLLSVSGHKLHGPKGSGFLYIGDKVKIKPLIYGGGQQKGRRSGTENVPAIAGLSKAADIYYTNYESNREKMYSVKKYMIDRLSELEGVYCNAVLKDAVEETAPHILSVSFDGVRSEVLLHALENKGIYVSAGSACSSNHPAISGTLKAIGVKKELLDSTLRFSFSINTSKEEIDYCIEVLKEELVKLRRFVRH